MDRLTSKRRRALHIGALLIALALLALPAASAQAESPELAQFCPNGSAPGQCNIPRGVAAAPAGSPAEGDIYVADQSNHRIQRFSAWGEFIGTWGSRGTGKGEFESPQGVAVDSS